MTKNITLLFSILSILATSAFGQKKANLEGIEIGSMAPEIELPTINGDEFKLSDIEGKLVLVSFWASWCSPCRKKSSELLKVFYKYEEEDFEDGEKGFEVVYVSLDKNSDIWRQSIKKDSIGDFYNVGDMNGWRCKAAQTYNITRIPSSVLLDGDGKIIAMNLSPKDLNKKLKGLRQGRFFWF